MNWWKFAQSSHSSANSTSVLNISNGKSEEAPTNKQKKDTDILNTLSSAAYSRDDARRPYLLLD